MKLYEVILKSNAHIFVLADNENNAIYKAYKKAVAKACQAPNNNGFSKWRNVIKDINELYNKKLDEEAFNLY